MDFAGKDLTDSAVDDQIYQRARQVVSGLIQHITYNEFLPSTLGFNGIPIYPGYDSAVNSQIANEFAAAAYRIGHSTLQNELQLGGDTSIALAAAFFQPQLVLQPGIEGVLEGVTLQEMQEVDNHIVDAVGNFLDDGPGFDLAAINIQRGRDHGLSDFNTIRTAVGLELLRDFFELTADGALARSFREIYGTPDQAAPWMAMFSEDHLPGTMVGETMFAYLVDQFTRLRDGDRFYVENALDDQTIAKIKATRLSEVIEQNTDLDVQDEVFWTRDTLVFRNGLDNEWLIRDFGEQGGAEVVFFGEPGVRDRSNREETVPVTRDEPINALIVAVTNELGDGFFIPNALVSASLADRGIDEFIVTADVDFIEMYGLGGRDTLVVRSDVASIFSSGDEGDDRLFARTNVVGAEAAFIGGPGRDQIRVNAPRAASIVAIAGAGNDLISINARRAASAVALGGRVRDILDIRIGRDTRAQIDGGPDQDRVTVDRGQRPAKPRRPRPRTLGRSGWSAGVGPIASGRFRGLRGRGGSLVWPTRKMIAGLHESPQDGSPMAYAVSWL